MAFQGVGYGDIKARAVGGHIDWAAGLQLGPNEALTGTTSITFSVVDAFFPRYFQH